MSGELTPTTTIRHHSNDPIHHIYTLISKRSGIFIYMMCIFHSSCHSYGPKVSYSKMSIFIQRRPYDITPMILFTALYTRLCRRNPTFSYVGYACFTAVATIMTQSGFTRRCQFLCSYHHLCYYNVITMNVWWLCAKTCFLDTYLLYRCLVLQIFFICHILWWQAH